MFSSQLKVTTFQEMSQISKLYLLEEEKTPNVGQFKATLRNGSIATVKVESLVKSLGLSDADYGNYSLDEKISLIYMLKERKITMLNLEICDQVELTQKIIESLQKHAIAILDFFSDDLDDNSKPEGLLPANGDRVANTVIATSSAASLNLDVKALPHASSAFMVRFIEPMDDWEMQASDATVAASDNESGQILETTSSILATARPLAAARPLSSSVAEPEHMIASLYDTINNLLVSTIGQRGNQGTTQTFLQLLQPLATVDLDMETFENQPPISPMNANGDRGSTEIFANLANKFYDLNGLPTAKNLEKTYNTIIQAATSTEPPVRITRLMKRALAAVRTPAFTTYRDAEDKVDAAIIAYNGRKLALKRDVAQWLVEEPGYKRAITRAQEDLNIAGVPIKWALDIIGSQGRNQVAYIISQDRISMQDQFKIISPLPGGRKFSLCYGLPITWYLLNKPFTRVAFSRTDVSSSHSRESSAYSARGAYRDGWFSVPVRVGSTNESGRSHFQTSSFSISFEVATIPIERPWFDADLFSYDDWKLPNKPRGAISSGMDPASEDPTRLSTRQLPYYVTALVIAKNVRVTGNWSSSDSAYWQSAVSGSAETYFGPFKTGKAKRGSSSSGGSSSSTTASTEYIVARPQIIGVINAIVPLSPMKNGRS